MESLCCHCDVQQALQDPGAQVPERRWHMAFPHTVPQELWVGGKCVQNILEDAAGRSKQRVTFDDLDLFFQVHSDKPGLWVAAAQWEFETLGNEDNGRQVFLSLFLRFQQYAFQILLRGLRFLPTSWTLHRLPANIATLQL